MSTPRGDYLIEELKKYITANSLNFDRKTVFGCNNESAYCGVFDLPADSRPDAGLLQDGPEYRAKPVLWAFNENGSIRVEQTEYTRQYLM